MPIYEYRCEKGHTFEVMQRMIDDPLTELLDLRRAGPARLPPGGGALQGLGLLQHRLRQEEGGRPPTDSKPSESKSSESSDSKKSETRSPPAARPRPRTSRRSGACRRPRRACRARPGCRLRGRSRCRSSTSVSSELPVAMSANRPIRPGPFMSVLSALGACQLTQGRRKNVLGRLGLGADRPQHLLLARGAVAVVLRRARTGSCARARSRAPACRRGRSRPCGSAGPSRSCRTAASRCASCC